MTKKKQDPRQEHSGKTDISHKPSAGQPSEAHTDGEEKARSRQEHSGKTDISHKPSAGQPSEAPGKQFSSPLDSIG